MDGEVRKESSSDCDRGPIGQDDCDEIRREKSCDCNQGTLQDSSNRQESSIMQY